MRSKRCRYQLKFGHFTLTLMIGAIAASGVAAVLGLRFVEQEFPDVSALKDKYPVARYQGRGHPSRIILQRHRPSQWVTLPEISRVAVGAVVVSEDWAFYQHSGYDPAQIKEAIKEDLEELRFARGASTITQQVVRNVFLTKDKNLWRKIKELLLAVQLERSIGKDRILEVYLNIAEWGEGIHGISQASRFYFQKTPSELTAREGAFLAMLLPSPKRYGQSFRVKRLTVYARSTVNSILSKMTRARYLSEEEKERELSRPLSFEVNAGES